MAKVDHPETGQNEFDLADAEAGAVESGIDMPAAAADASEESELENVQNAFVQLWGAMGTFWGISPATARVFAWLLSRSEPADSDSIMEGLEMSRGAVSMACRDLREWGLVFPEKASGSRKVNYRPATDLEKVIRSIVQIRKRREWDPVRESLHEWIPRLEGDPSPEAAVLRKRLSSMESLIELTNSAIEVFLKGGLVGRLGLKLLVNAARTEQDREPEKVMQLESKS